MRSISIGEITIQLDNSKEIVEVLERLLQSLSNKEVGKMLNISERTAARWKREGKIPSRKGGQVFMVDMVQLLKSPKE